MKKELITGTHGFIGSRLAERLSNTTTEVLSGDRHGYLPKGVHRVYDFAAYGNRYDQKEVRRIYEANLHRLINLLENARTQDNIESIIVTGSSSEYGKKENPMREDDALKPLTFYAASKAASTHLAQVYAKEYDLPVVVVRPFSVYGPGESQKKLIPTIIRSCLQGDPMTLDPNPKHDWIFIDDFVDGVLTIAENAKDLKGEVINLGTGKQYTNEEVLLEIEAIIGKRANITNQKQLRSFDTDNWVADITKAREAGWSPKVEIWQGLGKTVKYYDK